VASRFHALILGLVAGTPTVAISTVRKFPQQLWGIGLAELSFDRRYIDLPNLLAGAADVRQRECFFGAGSPSGLAISANSRKLLLINSLPSSLSDRSEGRIFFENRPLALRVPRHLTEFKYLRD
jgi:hypothetical protein